MSKYYVMITQLKKYQWELELKRRDDPQWVDIGRRRTVTGTQARAKRLAKKLIKNADAYDNQKTFWFIFEDS